MLVKRWGVLRRALPASIDLLKVMRLVCCLCSLHNYCINCRLRKQKKPGSVPVPLAKDNLDIIATAGVSLEHTELNGDSPEALLHGGMHHDDTSDNFRRQFGRRGLNNGDMLPCTRLLEMVERGGFKRPTPKGWE
jgi:hypothetical protein